MAEHHSSGCIICGQPLIYGEDELRTCAICGGQQLSTAACVAGHFVCDSCHAAGLDQLRALCLASTERNPLTLLEQAMRLDAVHMHGPEHHVIVPAVLLTCCANSGANIQLEQALSTAFKRGAQVPGGVCGNWGTCGAAIGAGIFASVALGSTPLNGEVWHLPLQLSSEVLARLAEIGGPRCCKRNSRIAIGVAIRFARRQLGVELPLSKVKCEYINQNKECINSKCPYFK